MRAPMGRHAWLVGVVAIIAACGLSQLGEAPPGPADAGGALDGSIDSGDVGLGDTGSPDSGSATHDAGGGDAPSTKDAAGNDAPAQDSETADDAAEAGHEGGCPGTSGSPMVSLGAFCIDSTEATQAQYALFLEAGAAPQVPPFCSWNTSYTPTGQWPPTAATLDVPVTSVDWCDAYAFCAWAGKRMCGRIGGGPVDPSLDTDAGASQWFYACSHDGQLVYPYGNTYGPVTCNGGDANGGNQIVDPVGSFTACIGGFAGVYDMSGNVREWEDSCSGMTGANDMCNERGGSVNDGAGNLTCAAPDIAARTDSNSHLGIRCCGP